MAGGDAIKVRKANPELLLHEQKRKVEIDLLKLEEELEVAGMRKAEIQTTLEREPEQMMRAVDEGALRYDSELEKKTSHQLALEKEKEMEKFERAVGINKTDHVTGQAFDQELQAKMRVERMQARAEQEKQRLEAAKKAEKAQKKAEKLRAKAEKAKKKAEAKLQKLKAKQEKQRIEEEKKAQEQQAAKREEEEKAERLEGLEHAEREVDKEKKKKKDDKEDKE